MKTSTEINNEPLGRALNSITVGLIQLLGNWADLQFVNHGLKDWERALVRMLLLCLIFIGGLSVILLAAISGTFGGIHLAIVFVVSLFRKDKQQDTAEPVIPFEEEGADRG